MKCSLLWVFDHIDLSLKNVNIEELVKNFNNITAEVDGFKKTTIDLEELFLANVIAGEKDFLTLYCPELKKEIKLKSDKDYPIETLFLIKKDKNLKNSDAFRLAKMADLGSEKDGNLPPISCAKDLLKGDWRDFLEPEDYLITIDNKAITNRPDLWGHRGIAREIVAILGVNLKNEEDIFASCVVKNYEKKSQATKENPLEVKIETSMCNRLSGVYLKNLNNTSSTLFITQRLAKVDARPVNAIVDLANYVMFDLSQPMHAFDAKFISNKLIARAANSGEKIKLIDGTEINLTETDCIISDEKKPLALAGIMGGAESEISLETKELFLESANFDAASIRKSAMIHKKRTEASVRFEKGLDPNQNSGAILRFLFLLEKFGIKYQLDNDIVSIGKPVPEKCIKVSHEFLIKKIGTFISPEKIIKIFQALGFGCIYENGKEFEERFVNSENSYKCEGLQSTESDFENSKTSSETLKHENLHFLECNSENFSKCENSQDSQLNIVQGVDDNEEKLVKFGQDFNIIEKNDLSCYKIIVPTYRQDIKIKEDLLEEVSRFVEYSSISQCLPLRKIKPVDNEEILRVREIKKHCAFGLLMHELVNYNFFDEEFLRVINWQPKNAPELKNPVSENFVKLVTTIVPGLFKAVVANLSEQSPLRFFEWAPVWSQEGTFIKEGNSLGLIWFDPKDELNFYKIKAELKTLFDLLSIDIVWEKIGVKKEKFENEFWYHPYQTAALMYQNKKIGIAGKVDPGFFQKFAKGDAFIVEINGDFLTSYIKSSVKYQPLSKYQKVQLDISMLIPLDVTVGQLENIVHMADEKIIEPFLVDYYENPEWKDKKSVTLRYTICDNEKTLTKEEIDSIAQKVVESVVKLGAVVR